MARKQSEDPVAGVRAVDRAIAILEAFSAARPTLSVIEIQEIVQLSRPTIYRLLETLAQHGYVRTHGLPQRYSLDYGLEGLRRIGWQGSIQSSPRDRSLNACTKPHVRPCLWRCFAANRISMSWSWSAPRSCQCHVVSARWTISPAERAVR